MIFVSIHPITKIVTIELKCKIDIIVPERILERIKSLN